MPSPVWPLLITLIHGTNIPGFYAVLLFTALDFSSITSHIPNRVLFSLWLCLFILSGVISPLFSSSILGTYWSGEFIFQCHIYFAFSYCSWGSQGKNTEVVCYSLLQWTTFGQNSPHDLSILSSPNMAWIIGGASGKEPACQWKRHKRWGFDPWARKIPWRREWQPTLVCLPVEFHGQRLHST